MHLLAALVFSWSQSFRVPGPMFRKPTRSAAEPVRRDLERQRNGAQSTVEDLAFLDLGVERPVSPALVQERDAEANLRGPCLLPPVRQGGYRGMWFDNSGMFRPLDARRDGDALVSKWGTPETEEGETTYRLLSDARMDIIDRVKSKDGMWREIGRSTVEKQRYRRKLH